MKASILFLTSILILTACHHDRSREDSRRHDNTPARSERSYDSQRTRTQQGKRQRVRRERRTQNMDSLPYLPPYVMRWNCPTEPQMLGYVTR